MTVDLGTVDLSSGTNQTAKNLPFAGIAGFIIANESGYTVTVKLLGTGYGKKLYPGTVDFFEAQAGFAGNIDFAVASKLNNVSLWPSAFLGIDGVGTNEAFNSGAYPMALPRLTGVSTFNVGSIANNLINTGNPLNTNVIKVSPAGDAANVFTVDTSGNVSIGDATNGGSFSVVGLSSFQGGIKGPSTGDLNINEPNAANQITLQNAGINIAQALAGLFQVSGSVNFNVAGGISTFGGIINANNPGTTVIGSAGNATALFPIWGNSLKIGIISTSGFTMTTQQFLFPTNVTAPTQLATWYATGGAGTVQYLNGASNVTSKILTALASTGGTQSAAQNTISKASLAQTQGTMDRIQLNSFNLDSVLVIFIGV